MDTATNSAQLLRLLQLASPALPVGAYSYSEGLETLVQNSKIDNAASLKHWLIQELKVGAVRLEAAMMVRAYRAAMTNDPDTLLYWNRWLTATRETEELRSQSLQMGQSLLRLFRDLEPDAVGLESLTGCNFAIAFGFVAATWEIEESTATLGYLQSWVTNLISAGVKLIPLGQTAGQRLLVDMGSAIATSAQEIATLQDDDLASCGWGLSLASMAHETLYSRLFRS